MHELRNNQTWRCKLLKYYFESIIFIFSFKTLSICHCDICYHGHSAAVRGPGGECECVGRGGGRGGDAHNCEQVNDRNKKP